jgi:dTDP-4-dehydrorhamnose 3,5-epimerase
MHVHPTKLPEVLLLEPDVFADERGFFLESWNAATFATHHINVQFVQDNHSHSARDVLRGLHYQLHHPQGKLVRVVSGAVLDVAVDIRRGSRHFGEWIAVELSAANHLSCYIPPGFAHGFCVLSESADFLYKCTAPYVPGDEYGIIWNDPDVGIEWPCREFIVSQKDSSNALLSSMENKLPVYQGRS